MTPSRQSEFIVNFSSTESPLDISLSNFKTESHHILSFTISNSRTCWILRMGQQFRAQDTRTESTSLSQQGRQFDFLRLPRELRDTIYQHYLRNIAVIKYLPNMKHEPYGLPHPLALVNSQVKQEYSTAIVDMTPSLDFNLYLTAANVEDENRWNVHPHVWKRMRTVELVTRFRKPRGPEYNGQTDHMWSRMTDLYHAMPDVQKFWVTHEVGVDERLLSFVWEKDADWSPLWLLS
jgi:hypothetical protein